MKYGNERRVSNQARRKSPNVSNPHVPQSGYPRLSEDVQGKSSPPLQNGLHRTIRHMPFSVP